MRSAPVLDESKLATLFAAAPANVERALLDIELVSESSALSARGRNVLLLEEGLIRSLRRDFNNAA